MAIKENCHIFYGIYQNLQNTYRKNVKKDIDAETKCDPKAFILGILPGIRLKKKKLYLIMHLDSLGLLVGYFLIPQFITVTFYRELKQ